MFRRLRGYRCYVLRIIAFIIFIKVFMKLRLNISQRCSHKEDSIVEYAMRLRVMSDQLTKLKLQNTELTRDRKRAGKTSLENIINIPSLNYEKKRRRIYENTNELWYYVDSELVKLAGEDIKIGVEEAKVRDTTQMIPQITDRIRILLADQEKLLSLDGFSKWRQKEMESVSSLVQRRLRHLQNPKNCSSAKKVVCKNKACGFGCQMHHIVYCLIYAYATERTLFFDTTMSNGSAGWHRVLLPFSEKCDIYKVEYKMPARNNTYNDDRQIIYLPEINDLYPNPEFLPLKIPEDLAERIHKFNGDPTSWWIGQFVKYLFKPNKYMQKRIKSYLDQSQFQHPIVGIHVRRPDRIDLDVQFHEFVEYMEHVKDYYDRLELTVPLDKRRIFIATDDTLSYQDIHKLFPTYTIIANRDIASAEEDRPEDVVPMLPLLRGFMIDVTMLSMCDHVIGTFSSSLDRLAYELMQGSRDASVNFISLDNIYHFGNRYRDRRVAVLPHKAQSRKYISFKPKDRITVYGNNYVGYKNGSQKVRNAIDHGNHYVGYSKGLHEQSKKVGQFLWYKTEDVVETFPFPTYKQVPIY